MVTKFSLLNLSLNFLATLTTWKWWSENYTATCKENLINSLAMLRAKTNVDFLILPCMSYAFSKNPIPQWQQLIQIFFKFGDI